MKVAVIGLGILGASAARSLALLGAEVTVYERTMPLAGTSGTTFAWTNSHNKNPRFYHDLNVAGMAEHAALAKDLGSAPPWLVRNGNLEWAQDPEGQARLDASVVQLLDRDYSVQWITPYEARSKVPDLRIPEAVDSIAYYPEEGHIFPALLLARLWGEARDLGVEFCCPAQVTSIAEVTDAVRLHFAGGGTADADAVLVATGRWTEELTASLGQRIAMADPDAAGTATVGLLGYTNPVSTRLDCVLTTPHINIRPDGSGRLILQGLDLDSDADPLAPPPVDGIRARELCRRLSDVLAGTDSVRIESLRVGQRALPADGLTVAGSLGDTGRVYVLATHSGVTLGPLLGRLAAQELVLGREEDSLVPFRPQRLLDSSDFPALQAARFAGQQ